MQIDFGSSILPKIPSLYPLPASAEQSTKLYAPPEGIEQPFLPRSFWKDVCRRATISGQRALRCWRRFSAIANSSTASRGYTRVFISTT